MMRRLRLCLAGGAAVWLLGACIIVSWVYVEFDVTPLSACGPPGPAATDSPPAMIFTLVSSNSPAYLEQTRVLRRAMARYAPEWPLHMLVTDDVSARTVRELERIGIPHVVSPYPNEPLRPHPNDTWIGALHPGWIHQLTKIRLWSFYSAAYVCYMDSDVVFFGDGTLQGVVAECVAGLKAGKDWCVFEDEATAEKERHWGMTYATANFFCLRPDRELFRRLEAELVHPFTHGQLVYKGRYVATEQDLLNLFFDGRMHYVSKHRRDGRFFHTKATRWLWLAWEWGLRSSLLLGPCR
jgi:hypothetical protein